MSHAGLIIFIVYCVTWFGAGHRIVQRWFNGLPKLLTIAGAFLIGIEVSVPVTYAVSCLFSNMSDPILWGTAITGAVALVINLLPRLRSKDRNVSVCDWSSMLLVLFALLVSTWIMVKTFHAGVDGQVYVGSNNIFDFGHSLGIVRSFSWGANIPFGSPFMAGLPFFYHFFFYFWVSLWEHFGIPIAWAMNIPSILSFTALLIVVYYLPQIILKSNKLVGWITVVLTVTNSSLTFWQLLLQKGLSFGFVRDIWRLPAYPFAGPFDGSVISIFMTLNNYVNQRHLSFSIALGLLLIMAVQRAVQTKKFTRSACIAAAILTGLSFFWNMAIFILLCILIPLLLLPYKGRKQITLYLLISFAVVAIQLSPLVPFFYNTFLFLHKKVIIDAVPNPQNPPTWSWISYMWQNLGLLPLIAGVGFLVTPKKVRKFTHPFIILFAGMCLIAAFGKRGFDQKFLSFLIIGINVLAAIGLTWVWDRKRYLWKIIAVMIFAALTVSGFVDLMPIKNEFAYPFVAKDTIQLISWIHESTPKNAVFVSYADMIDPVVLAGRKNYFGFFGNIGWYDRSPVVSQVYRGDIAAVKANHISYILIPKWRKNDFPYAVDNAALRSIYPVAFEDDRVVILGTGLSL